MSYSINQIAQPLTSYVFGVGGSTNGVARQLCAMEVAALLAGEPLTDEPKCVCPGISMLTRWANDELGRFAPALINEHFGPLIRDMVGTATGEFAVVNRRAEIASEFALAEIPHHLSVFADYPDRVRRELQQARVELSPADYARELRKVMSAHANHCTKEAFSILDNVDRAQNWLPNIESAHGAILQLLRCLCRTRDIFHRDPYVTAELAIDLVGCIEMMVLAEVETGP